MVLHCRTRCLRRRAFTSLFCLLLTVMLLCPTLLQQTGLDLRDLIFIAPAQWPKGRGAASCTTSASASTPATPKSSAGFAPYLPAAKLMCRPLASDLTSIPKLLHQSWKTTQLPAKFERWSRTCREKHPDWEWVLWTDEDNLELVRRYFPWLVDTYLSLPGDIYRVDLARNLYLYLFGGVYLDLDTECLHPVSSALSSVNVPITGTTSPISTNPPRQAAIFGRMGSNNTSPHSIPNAWMASTPGHPFFLSPLVSARAEIAKSRNLLQRPWYDYPPAEEMTGPNALRETILSYQASGLSRQARRLDRGGPFAVSKADKEEMEHGIELLDEKWVYPFDWGMEEVRGVCSVESDGFDAEACKKALKVEERAAVSITYWSHTHRGKGVDEKNIEAVSRE
ncbi:glycosyltransferase family 32 protein [Coniochaeta sp. 2T2.1]|nr:glycosyltransferase family 32 protein [Coniochaeta sp. 2T2.1]